MSDLEKNNKGESFNENGEKSKKKPPGMGHYVGAGIPLGVAIGAVYDNIAIGIAIGIALGTAIGVAIDWFITRKQK